MKAVTTPGDGTVVVIDVPEPELHGSDDAIIKVTAAAVCGTDLHFIKAPVMAASQPLGHEFVGEITALGPEVSGLAVGDLVKANMFVSCGHCPACLSGRQQLCPSYQLFGGPNPAGTALPGGQAEFVSVPHATRTLTKVPAGMSSAVALLLTDTLPTAWAAVVNAGDPAGKSFAVVGAGPVGQQVIAVAYALGAAVVYAVDFDERRLASAAKLGAVAVPGKDQPGERILELTGGRGVDVSFDAVGSQAAVDTAMTAVARGGALGLVGAFLGGDLVFAVQQLMHKNVEVHPIMGNPYASEHLITGLLTSGRLSLDEIVDVEVPLAEAPAAYEAFASRTINKAVLLPQA